MAQGGCCSQRSSGKCDGTSVLGRITSEMMMVVTAAAGVTTIMKAADQIRRAGTTVDLARTSTSIAHNHFSKECSKLRKRGVAHRHQ
jgi:hypothetical protein